MGNFVFMIIIADLRKNVASHQGGYQWNNVWTVNFQWGYHDRAKNAKEIATVGGILVTFVSLGVAPPFRLDKGCNILSEINRLAICIQNVLSSLTTWQWTCSIFILPSIVVLHALVIALSPSQWFPPFAGSGLAQYLNPFICPFLQGIHMSTFVHPPWTTKEMKSKYLPLNV